MAVSHMTRTLGYIVFQSHLMSNIQRKLYFQGCLGFCYSNINSRFQRGKRPIDPSVLTTPTMTAETAAVIATAARVMK